MEGSKFINAFSYITDLERVTRNHILYIRIAEILERFDKYIVGQRDDVTSYKDVFDATMSTVMNTFNGNWDTLESHVTNTAAKVPIKSKTTSLDKVLEIKGNGESIRLKDIITEGNRLDTGLRVNPSKLLADVKSSEYLWSDWVESLRQLDLETMGVTYEDITYVISATMVLDLLDFYAKEEIALTALGKLDKDYYTKYYKTIVNKLRDHFKMSREEVQDKLSTWGALYLQNKEMFKKQFHYLLNSKVVIYNNSAPMKVSSHFNVKDGLISRVEGSKGSTQIYKFRYDEVLDLVFDEYFKEDGSKLVLTIGKHTYFNVFGGIFTEERNLIGFVKENLKEYIVNAITCGYIVESDDYLYLSIQSKQQTIIIPMYYFGIMFTITLDSCGDFCSLE